MVQPHGNLGVRAALPIRGGGNRGAPLAVARCAKSAAWASTCARCRGVGRCTLHGCQPLSSLVWAGRQDVRHDHRPGAAGDLALVAWRHEGWLASVGRLLGHRECGHVHPPPHGPHHSAAFLLVLAGLAAEQTTRPRLRAGAGRVDAALCAHDLVAVGDVDNTQRNDRFRVHPVGKDAGGTGALPVARVLDRLVPTLVGADLVPVGGRACAGRHRDCGNGRQPRITRAVRRCRRGVVSPCWRVGWSCRSP